MNFRHTPGTVDVMYNVHDVKGCFQLIIRAMPESSGPASVSKVSGREGNLVRRIGFAKTQASPMVL